ncbi:MAG: Long-chain-fatty-acid--CoA ligase [Acidobacteriaceae bacterium]|nr:Long-chain-fatty-acid--CoA ligase [Acidobacteriaceae bacterium]
MTPENQSLWLDNPDHLNATSVGQSMHLLDRISRAYSELSAQDAFVVPGWFADQRSWVRDPQNSNSAIFNFPLALEIAGTLNHEAMRHALQELQARQQVFRSVFRFLDDQLIQIVLQQRPVDISVTDLTALGEAPGKRDAEFRRIANEEAGRAFDLRYEPALRARLLQFSPDKHALLLTTHHLICDDWSTGILLRELFGIYESFLGRNSSLQPVPSGFQYADFIRWHEKQMQGTGMESRLSFWKRQLAGGTEPHLLEPDHPRPLRRTFVGATARHILSEELTNSLKTLSQHERVSLFMTLLAGFQCILHRFSGSNNIAVGSCAANRRLTEVEGLIGRFANDLVVRTDLSGNPTFRDLLARVRKSALTSYSYQDLPFARLLEEIDPRKDLNCNRLFQVMFILQDSPKGGIQSPRLTINRVPLDVGTAKYDLAVFLTIGRQLEIALEYNTDLFEAATIRQIFEDYRAVLEAMCNSPETRVGELAIQKQRAAINSQQLEGVRFSGHVAPSGPIESRLVELWESVLDKRPIGVNDDFFELGGDSLRAARLFAQIEQKFERSIPVGALFQAPTIATLAKLVSVADSNDACVVTIQAGGTLPPLFCLPGQTGSVLMYRSLAQHLGSDQPVYGLQPQGLDGKQPPLTRIEDMAANFLKKIQLIQSQGPYFLAGYCMGGTIALEMAQQLRRQGQTVGLLAMLDTYNWGLLKRTSLVDDFYFRVQQWWFSWRGGMRWKELRGRRDPYSVLLVALPGALPWRKKSLKRLSEFWTKPAAQLVSECSAHAAYSYVPQLYPGRILHVSPARQCARYKRPEFSLRSFAKDGLEEFFVRGYPAQILAEPLVLVLAAKLRAWIDEVAAKDFYPD